MIELSRVPADKIVVTPLGVDAAFRPGGDGPDSYLLYVSAIEPRKQPLLAADAANALGKGRHASLPFSRKYSFFGCACFGGQESNCTHLSLPVWKSKASFRGSSPLFLSQ